MLKYKGGEIGVGEREQLSPILKSGGAVPSHFFQCPVAKIKQLPVLYSLANLGFVIMVMHEHEPVQDQDTLIEQRPNYSNRTFSGINIICSAMQLIQSVYINTYMYAKSRARVYLKCLLLLMYLLVQYLNDSHCHKYPIQH